MAPQRRRQLKLTSVAAAVAAVDERRRHVNKSIISVSRDRRKRSYC
jgi:hypothetical protein